MIRGTILVLLCATIAHCRTGYRSFLPAHTECTNQKSLVCDFTPTKGNYVTGRAIFSPIWHLDSCHVRIQAIISGLSPARKHVWHIHVYGDISSPNGKATGAHFVSPSHDPGSSGSSHGSSHGGSHGGSHGSSSGAARTEWGQIGHLLADSYGDSNHDVVDLWITLQGIVGRGIIIHGPQSSAPRIAQCVIGYANPSRLPAVADSRGTPQGHHSTGGDDYVLPSYSEGHPTGNRRNPFQDVGY